MTKEIKTKIVVTLLLLCCFSCAMAKKRIPPSARICSAWIESNVNQNNGLVAHIDFDVENWTNELMYLRLFIYDNEKKRWLGSYKNECCLEKYSDICRIIYDEVKYRKGSSYRDVKLYIPLNCMQLKRGTNRYYASVEVGRLAETLARSKLMPFTASGTGGAEGTNQDMRLQMFGGSLSHNYEGPLNDCTPEFVQSSQPKATTNNTYSGNRSVSSNSNYKSNQSSLSAITGAILVIGALAAAITSLSNSKSSSSSSSRSSSSSSYSRSSYSSSSSSSSSSLCSYCSGRGMMNCVWCYGRGIRSGGWFSSDETCSWCKGRGQVWCYHCNGKGSR